MKTLSVTDLVRRPKEVFTEAEDGAVVLTRHGRESFVLLSYSTYNYMSGKSKASRPEDGSTSPP